MKSPNTHSAECKHIVYRTYHSILVPTFEPSQCLVCQRASLNTFTNAPAKFASGSNWGVDSLDWVKKPRNATLALEVDTKAAYRGKKDSIFPQHFSYCAHALYSLLCKDPQWYSVEPLEFWKPRISLTSIKNGQGNGQADGFATWPDTVGESVLHASAGAPFGKADT